MRKAVFEGRARSFQQISEFAFPLWLGLPPPDEPSASTLDVSGLSDEDQDRVRRYASALARGKAKNILNVIDVALAGAEYQRGEP